MVRWIVGIMVALAWTTAAQAELYVAGQVGGLFPEPLRHVEWSSGGVALRGNDFAQQSSLAYGGKIGYYAASAPWIGVESDLYYSTPNLKQQALSLGNVNFGTADGVPHQLWTWAPANLMLRAKLGRFEPYLGGGVALFWSHLKFATGDSDAVSAGLNGVAGLRVKLTDHLGLFGEWKYNYAEIKHQNISNSGVDVKAQYSAQLAVFGVSVHF